MRVGEFAHLSGLTTTTIRYYEDIGLAPVSARAPNGYRDYGAEAVERLRASRELYAELIARAKRLDPAECTDPDRCQTILATPGQADRAERMRPHAWQHDSHGPPGHPG